MVTSPSRSIPELEEELAETYRSVTELTNDLFQANELLRSSNEKLSSLYKTAHKFVDNLSHEFRTPLTVIKEFSAILRDGLAGDINAEQGEYLDIIINRVGDLNLMVNDMLDISRIESGLLGVVREEIHVVDIVEHIKPTLEQRAKSGGVKFTIEIDRGLPTVYCDADKIRQVIINLVVNAFKFSGESGDVKLWAHDDADQSQIVIGVSDNGAGIDPEYTQAIFERFKQVGNNVRASTKGFGLGLNIAKELVQLNLGDIGIESELGKGSTFSFTVPTFDPMRLVERLLARLARFNNNSSYISVVTARIGPEVEPGRRKEVERFIQQQLRHTDLVLYALPCTWLIFLTTNQKGGDQMIARLETARIKAARERPEGCFPTIQLEASGTWRIVDQCGQLANRCEAWFGPAGSRLGGLQGTGTDDQGYAT